MAYRIGRGKQTWRHVNDRHVVIDGMSVSGVRDVLLRAVRELRTDTATEQEREELISRLYLLATKVRDA